MPISSNEIVIGKITGITKFGAFVELQDGRNGLIHISEISNDYVDNIDNYVQKGDEVKVVILSEKDNKLSLSMKACEKKEKKPQKIEWTKKKETNLTFEDKLSKFLKDSNEKIHSINSRESRKNRSRSRNR